LKNAGFSQRKYLISSLLTQSKSAPDPTFQRNLYPGSNPNSTKFAIVRFQSNPSQVQCSSLLNSRGEHGLDQDWISCRILGIFSDHDWIWIFVFEKLDQDRIRIFVWFL